MKMLNALREDNHNCVTLWTVEDVEIVKGSSMENDIVGKNM